MERCVAAGVNYVYELANGSPVLAPTAAGAQPLPPAQLEQQGVPVAAAMAQDMAAHTAAAADLVGAPPGPGNSVPPGAGMVPAASAPSDENYCLRWNEYEKKYAETFRVLRDDEYFTDVTLATEGHSVKAHRVILSACSNYFHAILKTMSPWQHPVLLLQDVRSSDLNSLMDFIYFGQASVSQDSLQSFLRVAEKLKIKGLCESLAPPPPPPLPVATTTSPPTPQPPPLPPSSHSTPTGLPPGVRGQPPPPPAVVPPPPVPVPVQAAAPMPVPVSNFEGLLPRTPYIPEPSVVPLSTQTSTVMSSQPPPSVVSPLNVAGRAPAGPPAVAVAPAAVPVSAPPPMAHQSPRLQSSRPSAVHPPPPPPAPRPATETLVHYAAPPKRAKYGPPPPSAAAAAAASMSPQSILQRQLQLKEGGGTVGVSHPADHVEVKSEPMSILSNPQEPEVPSSGVAASVTEFITSHDSDLALQTIGQGISPGFMFSPDPAAAAAAADGQSGVQHVGQNVVVSGANGPPAPTATLVTIDGTDGRGGATIVSAGGGGSHPGNVVTSMATLSHHQQPPQQVQQQQQQHTTTHHLVAAAHHVQQQQQQQPLQQHHPVIPQLPQTPHPRHPDEPQDLTPGPQDSPAALTHTPPAAPSTPSANNGPSSVQTTPGTPTPGTKV